jgi:DNA ligase-1
MKFHKFAEYLQKLEDTTKRLEITDILSDLIKNLEVEETDKAIYLSSGYLSAPFESEKFNIAEKMMIKILENTYSTAKNPDISNQIREIYTRTGDLGNVAFELAKDLDCSLLIKDVHQTMKDIAKTDGAGSQDLKIKKTTALLKDLDKLSAKFAVRIILGTTRLGFTELTIIDALSNYLDGTKSLRKTIESRYSIHPDIGLIARKIRESGLNGIDDIHIETGVPVLSQKPQRLKGGLDEIKNRMDTIWAEYKFDGTRVQLHLDKNKPSMGINSGQNELIESKSNDFMIKTFTRNLEETTHQYPDITEGAAEQIQADSVILDCEAIAFDRESGEFLPFQETIQRKRKHGIKDAAESIPLKCFIFDILYLNGKSLIDTPLEERRKKLKKIVKEGDVLVVDEHLKTTDLDELKDFFETAVEKKLEGLIAKNPEDPYQAGARSYSWVKLKIADENLLEDSIDCVVLGYYHGKGVRSKFGIGGFLAGIYDKNNDTFKTLTKVGTGLKDDDWTKLKDMSDKVKTGKKPSNVEMNKIFEPDVYLTPSIVVELGADEISKSPTHSAGYALRFPRLLKFRSDKSPTESTSLEEIKNIYISQKEKA